MQTRLVIEKELGSDFIAVYDKGLSSSALNRQFLDGFKVARMLFYQQSLGISFSEAQAYIIPYIERVISEIEDGNYKHNSGKKVLDFVNKAKDEITHFYNQSLKNGSTFNPYSYSFNGKKYHFTTVDIGQLDSCLLYPHLITLDDLLNDYLLLMNKEAFKKLITKTESFLHNIL